MPFTFDLDIGFIHAPAPVNRALILSSLLVKKRGVMQHPAVKRRVINIKAALGHHLLNIAIAECICNVPTNTLQNDEFGIVTARERDHGKLLLQDRAIIP